MSGWTEDRVQLAKKQKVPGLPYCEHHCRRAFRPPEARKIYVPVDAKEKENA